MTEYDAIVIGVGTAGGSVLWPLHEAGLQVAAVERELVGGLCAYWGCIPSKTLLRPGTIGWEANHGFGVEEPVLDWPQIARYRNDMVHDWNDSGNVKEIQDAGINFYRGEATITGAGRVRVGEQDLRAERIIIATGTEAAVPPIDGLAEAGYWTNREATSFQKVPNSVLIIGGGAVGCELGQVFHSFGAAVTIVDEADHLLSHESPDAAQFLERRFRAAGIDLVLGSQTVKVERDGGGRTATLSGGRTISAEVILVATGRRPNIEGLGLEHVGVKTGKKGIEVDEHCRAAAGIWAAGDVTGVAGYTHVADYQGGIVVADILGRPRAANYSDIPSVTYTDPEVASVGITDAAKAPDGMHVESVHVSLDESARAQTYGKDLGGGLSVFADADRKVLVGAWAVGPLAGEWIQFATLAIRARVPIDILDDTILAFPTFTRLYLQPVHALQKKLNAR